MMVTHLLEVTARLPPAVHAPSKHLSLPIFVSTLLTSVLPPMELTVYSDFIYEMVHKKMKYRAMTTTSSRGSRCTPV